MSLAVFRSILHGSRNLGPLQISFLSLLLFIIWRLIEVLIDATREDGGGGGD